MGDETRVCVTCGRSFTWSYGEQRFYGERGLDPPTHCPEHRPTREREVRTPTPATRRTSATGSPEQRWEAARNQAHRAYDALHPEEPPARPMPTSAPPLSGRPAGIRFGWGVAIIAACALVVVALLLAVAIGW